MRRFRAEMLRYAEAGQDVGTASGSWGKSNWPLLFFAWSGGVSGCRTSQCSVIWPWAIRKKS